ncbi:MAG: glutamate--tRNA ligase [Pseudomonadota bacterium]
MANQVVTRFAPSPTGFLHIGGARTALFNWLFAKANNGTMLLRIEDTDRERSTQEAIDAIIEGLTWLGLDWRGEPVFQFAQAERHREVVEQLITNDKAYYCYCSPEELDAMRSKAKEEGRIASYDGTWRDRDPSDAPTGTTPVVRFKAPQQGETVINDVVQGRVVVQNKQLDDLILLRSDGTPTYNLSVVVDDHDMNVSHIIRGDDHLTNALRQSQIYTALGWNAPTFAHIPLIHGPDGAKLSKRHGALGTQAYRDMGFLPEALRNYFVRLGWSHGDEEIFSTEQAIEWFTLEAIGKSPSRFDIAKLNHINAHYIRQSTEGELIPQLQAIWHKANNDLLPSAEDLTETDWARLKILIPSLKERAKTLLELPENALFLFAKRPLNLTEKANKTLNQDSKKLITELISILKDLKIWNMENIETAVKTFADAKNLKFGKVAQPIRAALTGGLPSPGIYDVMMALGQGETLARLSEQSSQ